MEKNMRKHEKKVRRLALLAALTALAMILSYVEAILPPIFAAVPGIKIGLPNIVIIFVLYTMGVPAAALVSVVRIVLTSQLFGSPLSLIYSLAGAALSLAVMALLKKINVFSAVAISVTGGVAHNVGQILMAMLLLETAEIGYYMIVLAVTGTLAGLLVGLLAVFLINRFGTKQFMH